MLTKKQKVGIGLLGLAAFTGIVILATREAKAATPPTPPTPPPTPTDSDTIAKAEALRQYQANMLSQEQYQQLLSLISSRPGMVAYNPDFGTGPRGWLQVLSGAWQRIF